VPVPPEFVLPGVVVPGVEDPDAPDVPVPVPGVLLSPEAEPSPPLDVAIPPPKMLDFAYNCSILGS
jgi:hypothetical protein